MWFVLISALLTIGQILVLLLIVRAIASWFPRPRAGSAPAAVLDSIDRVLEPLLAPIRRRLPSPGVGGFRFDLAPLVLIITIQVVSRLLTA